MKSYVALNSVALNVVIVGAAALVVVLGGKYILLLLYFMCAGVLNIEHVFLKLFAIKY